MIVYVCFTVSVSWGKTGPDSYLKLYGKVVFVHLYAHINEGLTQSDGFVIFCNI